MKNVKARLMLVSVLVLMLIVGTACGSSSAVKEGEDGGSSSGKTIEFRLGHENSTNHVQHAVKSAFAEEVAKATENRINYKIYPGGALGSPKESYNNVSAGIMDAGWGIQGYTPGKFPIHGVMNLPLPEGDVTAADLSVVAQKLYDKFPEIQAEYADVKPFWFHGVDPYMIVTKGKAVRSFADIKGLKLKTPHPEGSAMLEAWGATPINLPAPEMYDALQKGVIDGGVLPLSAIKDFNLFDSLDYVTYGNFNGNLFFMVMNKNSWNKVPAEDQKIIEGMIGVPMAQKAGEAYDKQAELAEKEAKEAGIEFITLPDEELKKFKDGAKVVSENWIKDMEAKGVPGQEIYDEFVGLVQGGE